MAQAVRDYDGSGDYCDLEVIDITSGAYTWVAVIEVDADATWKAIVTHQTAADAFRLSIAISNTNRLQIAHHNGTSAFAETSASGATPFTVTVADSWCILVVSKGAGTAAAVLSKYTPGSGWVHTTTPTGIQAPATQAGGKITIGRYQAASDYFNGKQAALALWNGTALNQTQVESLDGGDRQAWKSIAGGYTDLIEPAVAPNGTAAANWATNVASENGTLDMTATAGNGTIETVDLPPSGVYTLGVTAGTSDTVTAPPAAALGDFPAPAFQAGATVTAPPMDALGDFPASEMQISVDLSAPAALTFGDLPIPTVTGSGNATVTAPAATALGDFPAAVLQWGNTITAPPATALGDFPAPTVTGEASATVTAPAADALADFPVPTVSDGTTPVPLVGIGDYSSAIVRDTGRTYAPAWVMPETVVPAALMAEAELVYA